MAAACDESQWQLKDRLAAVCCNDGRQTRSSRPRLAGDVAWEPRSSWIGPLVIPDQRAALEVVHERLLGCHIAWPVTEVAGRGGTLDPLVAACLVRVGAQEVADRQMPPLVMGAGLRDMDVECAGPGGRLAEEGVAHHTV